MGKKQAQLSAEVGRDQRRDRLDSLNAQMRSRHRPGDAIRRGMEATIQRAAKKRRRQEQPSSSMLKS